MACRPENSVPKAISAARLRKYSRLPAFVTALSVSKWRVTGHFFPLVETLWRVTRHFWASGVALRPMPAKIPFSPTKRAGRGR